MTVCTILLAAAIGWTGVEKANYLGGRPASAGYLQGKVILLDCRDYAQSKEMMADMERLWNSFKAKPFVMVGSHLGSSAEAAKAAIKEVGVTYPVYTGVSFEAKNFERLDGGVIYVIDDAGRNIIKTRELRRAEECVVTALANAAAPRTAKRYRKVIDYELDVLPGKALNHLREFREKYPKEGAVYDQVWEKLADDPEVKRVAKLELIARLSKDTGEIRDPAALKAKLEKADAVYGDLKKSENPLVAQEAKNCLADIKWAAAVL